MNVIIGNIYEIFISNFLAIAQRQSLVYNSSYRKEAFRCGQATLAMIVGCIIRTIPIIMGKMNNKRRKTY